MRKVVTTVSEQVSRITRTARGRVRRAATAAGALLITVVMPAQAMALETSAQAPETLPKFKAGLANSFAASPFFAVLMRLTTDAAHLAGLSWLQPTDAQSDPGKQISDVQTLVNAGARGLIVVPRDSDAIGPAVQYAASRGVAVVAMDVGVNTGKVAMTVRSDNVAMGRTACEAIGARLGRDQGKVLELQGDLLNSSGRERTEGFESCMKARYPNLQILARPTRWEQARAADAAQTILTANPDLRAIYLQSGSIMLPGVLNVLRQAGHAAQAGAGHIVLVSIDGSPFELEKIRSGELDAAVSQPLNLYARWGVEYLRRAVKGETFAPGPTPHGSQIARNPAGNLEDLLPSPLVTRQNVNDPTLWGNLAGAK